MFLSKKSKNLTEYFNLLLEIAFKTYEKHNELKQKKQRLAVLFFNDPNSMQVFDLIEEQIDFYSRLLRHIKRSEILFEKRSKEVYEKIVYEKSKENQRANNELKKELDEIKKKAYKLFSIPRGYYIEQLLKNLKEQNDFTTVLDKEKLRNLCEEEFKIYDLIENPHTEEIEKEVIYALFTVIIGIPSSIKVLTINHESIIIHILVVLILIITSTTGLILFSKDERANLKYQIKLIVNNIKNKFDEEFIIKQLKKLKT